MSERITLPRVGRTPDILRKGGAMRDKTKYNRKTAPRILFWRTK